MSTHHNNEYIWVDSDESGGWKVPSRGDDTYNYTRQQRVEVMTLTITPDSDEDSEDEDLIDGDDRQIIGSTGTINKN